MTHQNIGRLTSSGLPSIDVTIFRPAHNETIFDSCEAGLNDESTVILVTSEFSDESELRLDRP